VIIDGGKGRVSAAKEVLDESASTRSHSPGWLAKSASEGLGTVRLRRPAGRRPEAEAAILPVFGLDPSGARRAGQQIAAVPGIGRALAEKIKTTLEA